MKNIIILSISVLFYGCNATKSNNSTISKYIQEPINEIQINPAPHPFHITHPYVIWVNGERLPMSKQDIILVAKEFNLSLDPPKDTAELHNGSGWLRPLVRLK
tara:strand:- start:2705 stop:3013 length:309 start_codon:yes stop_codon:yes gene_type:complete